MDTLAVSSKTFIVSKRRKPVEPEKVHWFAFIFWGVLIGLVVAHGLIGG